MLDFMSPCGRYKLSFEDNGKVAYAYLKERQSAEILGDVWLYNRCEAPTDQEWKDPTNIPFANLRENINDQGRLEKPITMSDVLVNWEYEEEIPVAYVYIEGNLFGVVGVGDKPGYARNAIKDGRLAKVMEIAD